MLAAVIVLILGSWSLQCFVSAGDVFASSAHLRLLADGEQRLVDALTNYLATERRRLGQLDKLLQEVQVSRRRVWSPESSTTSSLSFVVLEHPLNAFFMIRRFQTTWSSVNDIVFDTNATNAFNETRSMLKPYVPREDDFRGANLALARLQKTYNIPIEKLVNGIVAGRQTQPLSQREVLDIGLTAVSSGEPDDAIVWFIAGLNHNISPLVDRQAFYHGLARAHAQKKEFLKAAEYVTKALKLDPANAAYLEKLVPATSYSGKNLNDLTESYGDYLHLCYKMAYLNEIPIAKRRVDRGGSCKLQRSHLMPYQSFKVEYVHRSPDIIVFNDFVNQREAEQLKEMAVPTMVRALVGGGQAVDFRIGKTMWLSDKQSSVVARVSRRISDATYLDLRTAEPLQMSNYGLGGYYGLHYDSLFRNMNHTHDRFVTSGGDRIATFMLYLNDVTLGGATVFPRMHVGANPVKNTAIFWYNYDHSGSADMSTIHAACPVLLGEKWVANKWIHQYWQEFRRPCHLKM